ncbi:MAG: ArsR/SmtB family transcription factor [Pseudomonadota bacterium]
MEIVAQELFRAMADTTRLRCLTLLEEHDELCVCELTHALGLSQPKVSHHLGTLRKAGLVTGRKQGLWHYYRINTALPAWAAEVLHAAAAGCRDSEPYAGDATALAQMPNRPGAACSA